MSEDTRMAICDDKADRYLSLYVFIGDVSDELVKDGIQDLRDICLHDVSTLFDNSRSKIINLLKELYDNVQLSKLTTKQKIMDCAVKFKKDSISAFKRHLDLELKLLLSYRRKYVDDVSLNINTSNLISKSTDINMMVGDPSVAKSQLFKAIINIAPLEISMIGNGSFGEKEEGYKLVLWFLQTGELFVLMSFKMNDQDHAAIH
nr:DNA replication licensing factor MCM3 [Tanacetum cinerariifolium]